MTGLTFLIMFLILMVVVTIIPQILKKVYFPIIISIIIIGIIIGPNCLNLLKLLTKFLGRGIPSEQLYLIIESMGFLGLVFLMVLAGLEVDLNYLFIIKKPVILLSIFTFTIPAITGFFVYWYFKPYDLIGKLLYASLFASHSVGIVFPIIKELKITKTKFGAAVLSATVITDILSLILLAICVQLKRHYLFNVVQGSISIFDKINPLVIGYIPFFLLFFIATAFYIVSVIWLVPKFNRIIFKNIHPNDDLRISFFLSTVLLTIFIGELIGINIIVGAFLAGMALYRCEDFHANNKILQQKIEGIGYGILIPFLFLHIGMNTNILIIFTKLENILITILTILGLVLSKIFSGWLSLTLSGFSQKKSICAGLMTIPQLSATLAAAAVGLQLKIIDPNFFNAIIILSIVTTIPVPVLIKLLIDKCNIKFEELESKDNQPESDKELL